jgi:hypothetical protein
MKRFFYITSPKLGPPNPGNFPQLPGLWDDVARILLYSCAGLEDDLPTKAEAIRRSVVARLGRECGTSTRPNADG